MKGLEIDAIYENGMLKLPRLMPLTEGQKVTITIHPAAGIAKQSYGLLQSKIGVDEMERIAMDPDFGILESP
jgi:predicted DNA-binding antitoxin AbrB/MazE fold protein